MPIKLNITYKKILCAFLLPWLALSSVFAQWERLGSPCGGSVHNLTTQNDVYFTNSTHGYYTLTNDADTWRKVNEPRINDYYPVYIASLNNTYLVIYKLDHFNQEEYKLVRSKNQGMTWEVLQSYKQQNIRGLVANTYGFYMLMDSALLISTNDGLDWHQSTIPASLNAYSDVYAYDNTIYVTDSATIYRTIQPGDQWTHQLVPIPGAGFKLFVFDSTYFAVSLTSWLLYLSYDLGISWVNSQPKKWYFTNFIKAGSNYFAYKDNLLYKSTSKGAYFHSVDTDPFSDISGIASYRDSVLIGTYDGMLITDTLNNIIRVFDKGIDATWVKTIDTHSDDIWLTVKDKGIVKVSKSNLSDYQVSEGTDPVYDLEVTSQGIYATTRQDYLLKSVNNGVSWYWEKPSIFKDHQITNIFSDNNSLYVTTDQHSENLMFKKSIAGSDWQVFKITEMDNYQCPKQVYQVDDILFAVYDNKIARQNEAGIWEIVATASGSGKYISKIIPGTVMIGYILETDSSVPNEIFISTDTGKTWIETNTDSLFQDHSHLTTGLSPVCIVGQHIIGYNYVPFKQMYISSDFGKSWQSFGEGLPVTYITSLLLDQEYLYATTYGAGVYQRHIEDLMTNTSFSTNTQSAPRIDPNPNTGQFTLIMPHALRNEGVVFIHDMLGRRILTQPYRQVESIDFQLTNLSPGQYFLSLQTQAISVSSKIFLVQ